MPSQTRGLAGREGREPCGRRRVAARQADAPVGAVPLGGARLLVRPGLSMRWPSARGKVAAGEALEAQREKSSHRRAVLARARSHWQGCDSRHAAWAHPAGEGRCRRGTSVRAAAADSVGAGPDGSGGGPELTAACRRGACCLLLPAVHAAAARCMGLWLCWPSVWRSCAAARQPQPCSQNATACDCAAVAFAAAVVMTEEPADGRRGWAP